MSDRFLFLKDSKRKRLMKHDFVASALVDLFCLRLLARVWAVLDFWQMSGGLCETSGART